MLCYGSETDKSLPVQQHPILDVTKYLFDGKTLHIEIAGGQQLDLQASSKSEAKAIMVKISDSRTIAQKASTRVAPETTTTAIDSPQQHEPAPAMPPRPKAAVAAAPEPELRHATIMYSFAAEGGDEISVNEGDEVTVLMDDRQDGWCTIRTQHGEQGIVPETYVEMQHAATTTPEPSQTAMAMQRQHEEEERRRRQQQEEEEQRARERREEEERQQAAKREQEENERRRKLQEAAQRAEVMRQRQLQQQNMERSKAAVS